jgi:hypothetical protein
MNVLLVRAGKLRWHRFDISEKIGVEEFSENEIFPVAAKMR